MGNWGEMILVPVKEVITILITGRGSPCIYPRCSMGLEYISIQIHLPSKTGGEASSDVRG